MDTFKVYHTFILSLCIVLSFHRESLSESILMLLDLSLVQTSNLVSFYIQNLDVRNEVNIL